MFSIILSSCKNDSDSDSNFISVIPEVEVFDNTRELVMESTELWEEGGIGYFSVIKKDEKWYMWYQGWHQARYLADNCTHLCFAYSDNGKDWIKEISGRSNNIIAQGSSGEGWIESNVFIDPNDSSYPFRIIYNQEYSNVKHACFAKSQNGIDWVDNKIIFTVRPDSQYSVSIQSNGNYMVFLRSWFWYSQSIQYRTVSYAIIDPSGKILQSPREILRADINSDYSNIYNSAATDLGDNMYILFPTFFDKSNNKVAFKIAYMHENSAYIMNQDITNNLMQGDTFGFGTICPNLIKTDIKNEYWMYYSRRTSMHDNPLNYTTYYYRIKVRIIIKNETIFVINNY